MPKIGEKKKQQRIDHILTHALDIFAEKGYADASIDDIAAHAGVSKGAIYTYFKSKESIFLAIAEIGSQKRQDIVNSVKAKQQYKEKLGAYIDATLSDYTKVENFKRVKLSIEFWVKHYNSSHIGDLSKKAYIDKRFKVFSNDLKDILAGGIAAGEFKREIDVNVFAYIILTGIDGMTYAAAMLHNPITSSRIEAYKRMVLESILSRRNES